MDSIESHSGLVSWCREHRAIASGLLGLLLTAATTIGFTLRAALTSTCMSKYRPPSLFDSGPSFAECQATATQQAGLVLGVALIIALAALFVIFTADRE